tara:strand:- start:456 stop:755 length:300 start_codon:yes stop_codon:yes gene_type:complete
MEKENSRKKQITSIFEKNQTCPVAQMVYTLVPKNMRLETQATASAKNIATCLAPRSCSMLFEMVCSSSCKKKIKTISVNCCWKMENHEIKVWIHALVKK